MAVGNCRSSSNFWVFISQACFIILKINLFYDTNESAKWKNNRAEDVESSFSMFLIKGISLKCKKQFLIIAVGNCRSGSSFWALSVKHD
jgi:hypothetical protein